jgi:hypothetical protein
MDVVYVKSYLHCLHISITLVAGYYKITSMIVGIYLLFHNKVFFNSIFRFAHIMDADLEMYFHDVEQKLLLINLVSKA